MKIKLLRFLPLAVALIAQAAFAGDITIDVIPTLAPNADGSPSFPTWTTNALNALTSDATSSGTAGTPSFYQALSGPVDASQTIVTGFNSWLGQVNPASPYDQESGNRMTFGVAITTTDPTPSISLSQVGFYADSNDSNDLLGFGGIAAGYGPGSDPLGNGIGYDWSNGWVGVIYGPDGNTYVNSGPTTVLVNALYGIGSGNSVAAYCDPSSSCTTADQQAAIAGAVESMWGATQFTGTYYLSNNSDGSDPLATGSGTFDITGETPEPTTLLLLLAGLPCLMLVRRRFDAFRRN